MKSPLEFERHDNLIIFRLAGELSSFLLDRLKHELSTKVKEVNIYRVLINLIDVDYITSKDLGVFVQIYHFLEKEQKDSGTSASALLAFSDLNPFVEDVMEMTRLGSVFKVYKTEEEGIAELNADKQDPPESST